MVPVTGGKAEIRAEIKGVYENVPVDYSSYALSHYAKGADTESKELYRYPLGEVTIADGVGKFYAQSDKVNELDIEKIKGLLFVHPDKSNYIATLYYDEVIKEEYIKDINEVDELKNVSQEEFVEELPEEESPEEELPEEESPEEQLVSVNSINVTTCEKYSDWHNIFDKCIKMPIFEDDNFYDCVELDLEQLRSIPLSDIGITNNSFLVHGYYNFKHILLARCAKLGMENIYIIGVPGIYSNRERQLASMYGFNNFKRGHRDDCRNPYFGYWYVEMYI